MKHLSVGLALLLCCWLPASSIGAPARDPDRVASPTPLPILAWIGPPAGQATVERYKELASCGFNLSFSGFPNADAMAKALDAANAAGVKLLISYPDLLVHPEKAVQRFGQNPALGGYFLRDEPAAADFAALGELTKKIQSLDSRHPCYINLLPNYATPQQLGAPTYPDYVDQFIQKAPVPFISFDYYPIVGTSVRPSWYENLEVIRAKSAAAGKPFWGFALSLRHFGYPTATVAHLREQVYSNLAYGAQGIEYFTYWSAGIDGSGDSPIDAAGKRTVVYGRVQQVNAELRALSGVFVGSKVISIGHTGAPLPAGAKPFHPTAPIADLQTQGVGVIASVLENGPSRYLILVNRDIQKPTHFKLRFDASRKVSRVAKDGSVTPILGQEFTGALDPGDSAILRWMK